MKKYKEYMDHIQASDTLHQRLLGLEAPAKRPIPWKRYGSMAAALALVCGLGAWGLGHSGWNAIAESVQPAATGAPEIADEVQPDIILMEPGDEIEPGYRTLGGYDVTSGAMAAHYILPYIDYGNTKLSEVSSQCIADWDIPKGAFKRDMDRDSIARLLGGEDVVDTHLDWGAYELTGWAAWYENGDFWGTYLMGYAGPLDHFEFAVTRNQMPPTCIVYPGSVEQEINGVTVTADGHDGQDGCSRRVSFMKDDYGYRFDLTSTDTEQAERLVSRLVRQVADKGTNYLEWATASMGPTTTYNGDETFTCNICGNTFPMGTEHTEPGLNLPNSSGGGTVTCPTCGETFPVGDEKVHVHSFAGADPTKDSPRDRGENWCGTPDGDPDDATCSGYPVPGETYLCPICERTLPVGVEHSHELCGLPLAPADLCPECGKEIPAGQAHSHSCELCGEAYPAGQTHSCRQEEHHQENHHGSHY